MSRIQHSIQHLLGVQLMTRINVQFGRPTLQSSKGAPKSLYSLLSSLRTELSPRLLTVHCERLSSLIPVSSGDNIHRLSEIKVTSF